jgi:transposase
MSMPSRRGVPSKIMVDNLKSAVLQRLAGTAPVFNPRYHDFASHHGFTIVPCNAYQTYYNEVRTHLSLQKDAPDRRDVCRTGYVRRRSWAGYAINMFEFEFPTGTRGLVMNWKERNASRW